MDIELTRQEKTFLVMLLEAIYVAADQKDAERRMAKSLVDSSGLNFREPAKSIYDKVHESLRQEVQRDNDQGAMV